MALKQECAVASPSQEMVGVGLVKRASGYSRGSLAARFLVDAG